MKKLKINPFIFFMFTILYFEIIAKVIIAKHIFNIGLLYMLIFTIPIALLLTILTKAFNKIINKIVLFIMTIILTIYFEVQYIFFVLFSLPFSFSTIGLADQALDFTSIIKEAISTHLPIFLCFLLPIVLLILFSSKIDTEKYSKETTISLLGMFITGYLLTFLTLIPNYKADSSSYKLYFQIDDQTSIIDNFGLLTYTKIDIKRQIVGYETELIIDDYVPPLIENPDNENIEYGDNIIDIDFNSKNSNNKDINSLNKYMANQYPTNKSEYTGMFKGKNLIFILAEGYNEIAVDETRTPTLYKLTNSGFVFNNFYSPLFLSTTGGEFQATTGLIPTQETLKLWKSKQPTLKYALGNALGGLNYRTQSYHNWTYSYYKRDLTMPTLGYNNYLGCGNGLEKRMNCGWLPKDTEMIDVTTPDYLGKDGNFLTYYVTVSGHSPYNAGDNIAKIYFENLKDTNYSNSVKYYLAAQMELDRMLENLISKLEESGELENTVIALVGDHYPYTLSIDEMNEASSYKKDDVIEVNHSNFILWNSAMEDKVVVDKVGSQIDVLPTLLNLFGVEYDSRLIVGKDILSNYEGIAIFSNRSWVTDYGYYNSSSKKFTLKEGKELVNETEADYVKRINNRVANSFSISKLIIDNNYYTYILGS